MQLFYIIDFLGDSPPLLCGFDGKGNDKFCCSSTVKTPFVKKSIERKFGYVIERNHAMKFRMHINLYYDSIAISRIVLLTYFQK